MDYGNAIDYITDLTHLGINFGLGRTLTILERLDHPERQFPSIHIGGTNGKGSIAALVESVAISAGMKVAKFTSPHLVHYTERITINRSPISDEEFGALVEEIKPVLESVAQDQELGQPTEFEVGTILAFMYFARHKVDLAIIEVGLGGRLDSTNVLQPLAVGISHIDLDHQEYLGPDLASIAKEKSGIIKRRTPVVIEPEYPEVEDVLTQQAASLEAPVYLVGREISVRLIEMKRNGIIAELCFGEEQPICYHIGLNGAHQANNAAVAYGLIKILQESGFKQISGQAIIEGFKSVYWPGRLEWIQGQPPILMDGGHNPDCFRALSSAIQSLFNDRPIIGLIGIPNNRPVEEMATIIGPFLEFAVLTKVPTLAPLPRISAAFNAVEVPNEAFEDPNDALVKGLELARDLDGILLIAGSLHLVGHLRPCIVTSGG